jgi:hypothetical protein
VKVRVRVRVKIRKRLYKKGWKYNSGNEKNKRAKHSSRGIIIRSLIGSCSVVGSGSESKKRIVRGKRRRMSNGDYGKSLRRKIRRKNPLIRQILL